jgi:hypothetical protein
MHIQLSYYKYCVKEDKVIYTATLKPIVDEETLPRCLKKLVIFKIKMMTDTNKNLFYLDELSGYKVAENYNDVLVGM